MRFHHRADAGRKLADRLTHLRDHQPLVVGLPRGGVPVAAEIAAALVAELDIVLVRKVGAPGRPELAVGAVGEDGVTVRNDTVLAELGLTWADVGEQVDRERAEIRRRAVSLRPGGPRPSLRDRVVIVVDDGIATGATVIAAIRVLRRLGAGRIVLAVPVAPADSLTSLSDIADEVVCVHSPRRFLSVGQWFDDFTQVPDERVRELLTARAQEQIAIGPLPGTLMLPRHASGLVIFAHGSGSGRHSPRNQSVASVLAAAGIGSVLVDLLNESEDRFDIGLITSRLVTVTAAVRDDPRLAGLPVGYFGASTGAAAALRAAAAPEVKISAIVSRGGRPDLAADYLRAVDAPTLLIVGGRDEQVLTLNTAARERLRCRSDLAVVPGAGHLFEEPGALWTVARLATDWFERHFEAGRT